MNPRPLRSLFFFNDTAPSEIYTLSLHDALPISRQDELTCGISLNHVCVRLIMAADGKASRSEEHTSELQSHVNLVCRLLLEKKKKATWRAMRYTDTASTLNTRTNFV